MALTYTEKLSSFLVDLQFDSLSEDVIQDAKYCILDSLGCILAGASVKELPHVVKRLTSDFQGTEASVIGYQQKTNAFAASILHGMMGHVTEMDDVHKRAKCHAGVVVIPAALSYGERSKASGKEFLLSVITGYEVMLRIGEAINATKHRKKGWHATSTCGTFGAAAAVSKLARHTKEEFVASLGLAGTQSSGLWAFSADGTNAKMFHAGHAASCGIMSAQLATAGIAGSSQIIEAKDGGFFAASSINYNTDLIVQKLGNPLYITQVTRKPYACCRSMHPPIEAVLKLTEKGLSIENIRHMKVYTYEVAKMQCGFTNRPKNTSEAKFCIPYGMAVALYDGHALMDQFTGERIKDEKVLALAEKVDVIEDKYFSSLYPDQWGCRVEVELNSGEILTETVDSAKGDPVNPLTATEIEQKFLSLANQTLSEEQARQVIYRIKYLEQLDDIGQLVHACVLGHVAAN